MRITKETKDIIIDTSTLNVMSGTLNDFYEECKRLINPHLIDGWNHWSPGDLLNHRNVLRNGKSEVQITLERKLFYPENEEEVIKLIDAMKKSTSLNGYKGYHKK